MHRTIELGGQFVVLGTGHADSGLRNLAGGHFRCGVVCCWLTGNEVRLVCSAPATRKRARMDHSPTEQVPAVPNTAPCRDNPDAQMLAMNRSATGPALPALTAALMVLPVFLCRVLLSLQGQPRCADALHVQ